MGTNRFGLFQFVNIRVYSWKNDPSVSSLTGSTLTLIIRADTESGEKAMGLESAANIGLLIAIVGLMLFFLRRMDRMKDELKRDMASMEARHKEDMASMEANINLKHGEVREDLRDVRQALVVVGERQARLEGILEGMGHVPAPEPVATVE